MMRIMTIQAIALAGGIYLPLGAGAAGAAGAEDELWKYKERCYHICVRVIFGR